VDLAAAALEESSDPDYNVVLTTAFSPSHNSAYVVEYTRRRMNPSDVIDCIFAHWERYHPVTVKVEAIAYQRTLVHWLKKKQRKLNKLFYVEPITSLKGSKEERIRGLQPYLADGMIKIRIGMDELEKELLAFPKGAHDDIIDALHLHRGFWNEMAELVRQEKADKVGEDIFSGEAVIKELTNRFQDIRTYPYDIGNLADKYLMELQLTRPDLYERVRDSAELVRVRGNRALVDDLVLQGV
jgi:predicted phage terminase large subunit-like protein